MANEERIELVRQAVGFRRSLHAAGTHDRELRAAVADGELVRIAPGAYVAADRWRGWFREDRQLARVIAADFNGRGRRQVFSHFSAAAIWGLPLYGFDSDRVHVVVPGEAPRSTRRVLRHSGDYDPSSLAEIGGLLCTDIDRTVVDLARVAPPELAIGCLDAGLRLKFGRDVRHAQDGWREATLARLEMLCGHRGVRRAQRLIRMADGRADSVAESLSRLQLRRLGYEVEIQVEVPAPHGGAYHVDIEFLGLRLFGEVDGEVKYTDRSFRNGQSVEQVMLREKAREDWVRGTTGNRMIRWGFRDVGTAQKLAARLRAFRVPPPRRPGAA